MCIKGEVYASNPNQIQLIASYGPQELHSVFVLKKALLVVHSPGSVNEKQT